VDILSVVNLTKPFGAAVRRNGREITCNRVRYASYRIRTDPHPGKGVLLPEFLESSNFLWIIDYVYGSLSAKHTN